MCVWLLSACLHILYVCCLPSQCFLSVVCFHVSSGAKESGAPLHSYHMLPCGVWHTHAYKRVCMLIYTQTYMQSLCAYVCLFDICRNTYAQTACRVVFLIWTEAVRMEGVLWFVKSDYINKISLTGLVHSSALLQCTTSHVRARFPTRNNPLDARLSHAALSGQF